jgi:hypothetical protein
MDDVSLTKICCLCGRQGTRGFIPQNYAHTAWICNARWSCMERRCVNRKRERLMVEKMTQTAPYPVVLNDLVRKCTYRPNWTVELWGDYERDEGCKGLSLIITTSTVNSYHPDQPIHVQHLFGVPAATYDVRSWQRWLFERFRDVETHEAMEFFAIDGKKPYAPSHGPGNDPYLIAEFSTETDRRTSFRGELNP